MLGIVTSALVAPAAASDEDPTSTADLSAEIALIEAQMQDPRVKAEARKMLGKKEFAVSSDPVPDPAAISVGGCGFLRACVYFNRTEQRYIAAGSGAAVGAAICIAGTPAACVVAATLIAIAIANVYINDRGGICSGSLRVQFLPYPGRPRCA